MRAYLTPNSTALFTSFCLMAPVWPAIADPLLTSPGEAPYFYQIGGARAVSPAATNVNSTIRIGGSADFGLGYSCGKFDPKASVRDTLNNIRDQVVAIGDGIQAAAAALPGYIICRANPLMCQMLQNYTAKAEALYNVSVKSCEQMEAEAQRGENPFDDWITIRKSQAWQRAAAQGQTAARAKREVDRETGAAGVAWPASSSGRAGGAGQPALNPVADAAQIGYNLLLRREPSSTATVSAQERSVPLTRTWWSPADVQAEATRILGDSAAPIQDGQVPSGSPGIGLHAGIDERTESYRTRLRDMITRGEVPEPNQVEQPFPIPMTKGLLQGLAESPDWMIDRLASDAAVSEAVERGLLLRRVLITALSHPDVAAASPAATSIEKAISRLESDIDRLMFEQRVRKELTHQTASTALDRWADKRAAITPSAAPVDDRPLEAGAVTIEEGR